MQRAVCYPLMLSSNRMPVHSPRDQYRSIPADPFSASATLYPEISDRIHVFHVEFGLNGVGLKYAIGEALGVHGRNVSGTGSSKCFDNRATFSEKHQSRSTRTRASFSCAVLLGRYPTSTRRGSRYSKSTVKWMPRQQIRFWRTLKRRSVTFWRCAEHKAFGSLRMLNDKKSMGIQILLVIHLDIHW